MSDKQILRRVEIARGAERHPDFIFFCPGCKCGHGIWTTKKNSLDAIWTFDGNMEKPTFTPSLLIRGWQVPPVDPQTNDWKRGPNGKYILDPNGKIAGSTETVCHSIVSSGMIQFCSDCTHELVGKTVPMEAF